MFSFRINIAWKAGATVTAPVWLAPAAAAAAGAALGYYGYQGYKAWQAHKAKDDPPYSWDDLGWDPAKCPDKGLVRSSEKLYKKYIVV